MSGVPREAFERVVTPPGESGTWYRITVRQLWELGWRISDDGSLQPPAGTEHGA
jgi:hypothetical protein